ncbi:susd and RagB outer membrane lipoprotein domain protein [Arachidicoccus ginsenosidimutans]|uniref:SusD/RagB family nutrient-binding outer membrane lipoprotein n=1 Tax=Arachidicoccus sp. BS20 TaxID=1850526 RepID=UPI0007F0EAE3|nr:SusD/RagB family nutrient-binding outer membrane lipoprotein [Arachidicoccus sp. BS20]ANI90145.1 susd and RagB outer membrane lipoprotein domain protein [Arachidicoccus sp. BS20]
MKKTLIKSCVVIASSLALAACSKFDELNTDPTAASTDQVQVEYFIDNSIIHNQQNPSVSERAFILYWQAAGHQIADADGETFSWGSYGDEWIGEYYDEISSSLNYINSAVDVANQQITAGTQKPYTNNLLQVARIWRAYLMSEMSDCFGPIPIDGFQGTNPTFVDVKTVYYYLLDELKDASSKIDVSVDASDIKDEDPAFGYNFTKWQKYANSLRMRLAMRLSEVDEAKAQSEFEDAAKGSLLTDNADIFQIQEKPGWDDLSGVYTRSWYVLPIGVTLNNLFLNLGGVKSKDLLPSVISDNLDSAQGNIKAANYIGQKFPNQFSTMTNDPSAGYWLDGLPYTIDPRAYQMFYIPGNFNSPTYPSAGAVNTTTTGRLRDVNGNVVKTINAKYTWNPVPDGDLGTKGGPANTNDLNNIYVAANGFVPSLVNSFRTQTAERVFFAPWETYFLLAEAAERGWSVPMSGQDAYEAGIASSFQYWGVSQYLGTYLASTDYNRAGTSVSWNHTTEPGEAHTMNYVDGMTGATGTASIKYPVNNLYKNGSVRNDHLTKIITQKFIAQTPWLPLEAWSDHRRLGLPFFENVVIENPIQTLPALTSSNYMTSNVKFFPQREPYPSSLKNSNATGYEQAVSALGGNDAVLTPLWWAQH